MVRVLHGAILTAADQAEGQGFCPLAHTCERGRQCASGPVSQCTSLGERTLHRSARAFMNIRCLTAALALLLPASFFAHSSRSRTDFEVSLSAAASQRQVMATTTSIDMAARIADRTRAAVYGMMIGGSAARGNGVNEKIGTSLTYAARASHFFASWLASSSVLTPDASAPHPRPPSHLPLFSPRRHRRRCPLHAGALVLQPARHCQGLRPHH
jgi:hypothetical protein